MTTAAFHGLPAQLLHCQITGRSGTENLINANDHNRPTRDVQHLRNKAHELDITIFLRVCYPHNSSPLANSKYKQGFEVSTNAGVIIFLHSNDIPAAPAAKGDRETKDDSPA